MDRLKGWVSKEGTPCRYFKFQQQTDQRHVYVEEIPDNAIRAAGIVGQDLLTGVLFVTSEAITGDVRRLDEVEIIIIPKDR